MSPVSAESGRSDMKTAAYCYIHSLLLEATCDLICVTCGLFTFLS